MAKTKQRGFGKALAPVPTHGLICRNFFSNNCASLIVSRKSDQVQDSCQLHATFKIPSSNCFMGHGLSSSAINKGSNPIKDGSRVPWVEKTHLACLIHQLLHPRVYSQFIVNRRPGARDAGDDQVQPRCQAVASSRDLDFHDWRSLRVVIRTKLLPGNGLWAFWKDCSRGIALAT